MKSNMSRGCWFLVGMLISTSGFAEEYDFEIGLAFNRTTFDGSQLITTPGGTIFSSSNTDMDELGVFGSWYFAGLSDDIGPRARAAFVDRASSVGVGYSHLEQTISLFRSNDDPSFPVPPIDSVFDTDGDSLAVQIRYVDRDSGWFGNAGLLESNNMPFGPNGSIDDSSDATGWNLGVGKYLFETTALSLDVSEVDGDGGLDTSVYALTFIHLGNFGERWQYAIDVAYSRLDLDRSVDLDNWGATFALYPTRDFEFGINVEDVSADGRTFVDLDTTAIEGFASWFVTPNVQLSARYRVDDVSFFPDVTIGGAPTVSDADQDSFGISATVRF